MASQNQITRKEFENYIKKSKQIKDATTSNRPISETDEEKEARIAFLKSNEVEYCKYYFGHYMTADFGWFHKKGLDDVKRNKDGWFVWEWPRDHAKSVLMDVFVPMYLKSKGELTGVILVSQNEKKAKTLLGDLQAELANNQRYIEDFGVQVGNNGWADGEFYTNDGLGFWAVGRGQSPRGIRSGKLRPNLIIIDDIDDSVLVQNTERVLSVVEWIRTDLYGCSPIEESRFIMGGNRINQRSVLAHIVGDVEEGDEVNPEISHIKVFAIEDRKHNESYIGMQGARPAWSEKYTMEMFQRKFARIGYNGTMREYFHKNIPKGNVFKDRDIFWEDLPELSKYESLVSYCDPSFKDDADFKAIVLMGRIGKFYDVIFAWVQQASPLKMAEAHFDIIEICLNTKATHYFEANFAQDAHKKTYDDVAKARRLPNLIKKDKEPKPDKSGRIESLTPLFENAHWRFNKAHRNNPSMKMLVAQFLSFPKGHDDGPDACHGAYSKLIKSRPKGMKNIARTGKYYKNEERCLN